MTIRLIVTEELLLDRGSNQRSLDYESGDLRIELIGRTLDMMMVMVMVIMIPLMRKTKLLDIIN